MEILSFRDDFMSSFDKNHPKSQILGGVSRISPAPDILGGKIDTVLKEEGASPFVHLLFEMFTAPRSLSE